MRGLFAEPTPHPARYSRHPPRFLGSDGPILIGPEIGLPQGGGPLTIFVFNPRVLSARLLKLGLPRHGKKQTLTTSVRSRNATLPRGHFLFG